MRCEYVPYQPTVQQNRQNLWDGVQDIRCTYVGPVQHAPIVDLALEKVPGGCHLSSCEVYENGAINFFVRNVPDEPAIGFVRYRP